MPWPWNEFPKDKLAEDGDAVRPIESDGADVEDTSNGCVGTETDQVDDDAPEDGDPDGIERSAGRGVDLSPHVGEWQETITGEGEDGSAEGLHGSEAHELDDEETGHGEEDPARFAEAVVENLGNRLNDWACEDLGGVAHAEAEDDVEEEPSHVGEQHGRGNRPWGLDLWLGDFFGNVRCRIVIGHRPGDGEEAEKEAEANRLPAGG